MIAFRINAAGLTDKGAVRAANEDSMILRNEVGLWAVADGMGGHERGQWASEQITAALADVPLGGGFDDDVRAIGAAVEEANTRIFAAAEESETVIGSTVVILFIAAGRFTVFWAGDSRIYLHREAELIPLTVDHTYVNDLIAAGTLRPEEAKSHPQANVISRAVGVGEAVELDAVTDAVQPLDVFLLCSDGLTGMVSNIEIAQQLALGAPQAAAARLLDLALSRGASDNVTVVVVGCEEITKVTLVAPVTADV